LLFFTSLIVLINCLDSFYYLPNVSERVVEIIKECEYCTQHTPITSVPPLQPLISKNPMHIMMADFFGPIPPDPITGAKYDKLMYAYLFIYIL